MFVCVFRHSRVHHWRGHSHGLVPLCFLLLSGLWIAAYTQPSVTHSNAQGFTLCPFVLWLAKRNAHSCHSMHVHAPRTAPQKKSCQVPPNSHAPLLYMQMFTDAYLNNRWELCLACQWLLWFADACVSPSSRWWQWLAHPGLHALLSEAAAADHLLHHCPLSQRGSQRKGFSVACISGFG